MRLHQCESFYGRRRLISTPPSIRLGQDVTFVPWMNGRPGGLFEPSGRAVAESVAFVGTPSLHTPHTPTMLDEMPICPVTAGGANHYFIGDLNAHYGHFIVGALSRLWSLPTRITDDCKIVFSSTLSIEALMGFDFFREITSALGLSTHNLLRVTEPLKFDILTIPGASFEELSLVHDAFANLTNRIGTEIIGPTPPNTIQAQRRVIYLSKERLTSGITRITNETHLTRCLIERGVEVVFPETLQFREQLQLWKEDPIMIGFSGSFLHTSSFLPKRSLIALAHDSRLWVNQVLIDRANRNAALYLYDNAGLDMRGAGNGFAMNMSLNDPETFAAELVVWSRRMKRPRFTAVAAAS